MARARWHGKEYDIVNLTDGAEWVLRDDSGDVDVFEVHSADADDQVEVQCERCGRWSRHAAPIGGRWVCHDRECYDEEMATRKAS